MPTAAAPAFGGGAAQPYDRALHDEDRVLTLHEYQPGTDPSFLSALPIDVRRFREPADPVDVEALAEASGPVLDIGCGPGRMLRAAARQGHVVMGIDVSAVAVRLARRQGLPALQRSVFERVPASGRWGTALLMDGNIGIGGDVGALLVRCASLLRESGRVVVETHPDPARDRAYPGLLVDDLGRRSLPFAWAEVGREALRRYADRTRLVLRREWTSAARSFAEYVRS